MGFLTQAAAVTVTWSQIYGGICICNVILDGMVAKLRGIYTANLYVSFGFIAYIRLLTVCYFEVANFMSGNVHLLNHFKHAVQTWGCQKLIFKDLFFGTVRSQCKNKYIHKIQVKSCFT